MTSPKPFTPEHQALRERVGHLVSRYNRDKNRAPVFTGSYCPGCGEISAGAGICWRCARKEIGDLNKTELRIVADLLRQMI